jgi:hypothetical protein
MKREALLYENKFIERVGVKAVFAMVFVSADHDRYFAFFEYIRSIQVIDIQRQQPPVNRFSLSGLSVCI